MNYHIRCFHCQLWLSDVEPELLPNGTQLFVCSNPSCQAAFDTRIQETIEELFKPACFNCERSGIPCSLQELTEHESVFVCQALPCQAEYAYTCHMLNHEQCPNCERVYKGCQCYGTV